MERAAELSENQRTVGLDGGGAVDVAGGVDLELLANDFADDGGGVVKFEFACAVNRAMQHTFAEKIMAFNGDTADDRMLFDVNVAAGLNALMPFGIDGIVAQIGV